MQERVCYIEGCTDPCTCYIYFGLRAKGTGNFRSACDKHKEEVYNKCISDVGGEDEINLGRAFVEISMLGSL